MNLIDKDSLVYTDPNNLFLFLSQAVGRHVEAVKAEFKKMLENGDIYEIKKNRFIPIPSRSYVKGKFIGHAKGYAFCDSGTDQDVFIPANKTNGAIDGDIVIVKVNNVTDEGSDGEVVKIVDKVQKIVGTIFKQGKRVCVEPDNTRISCTIEIRKPQSNLQENQKVVVEIERTSAGKIIGKVLENLGESDDVKTLELAIVRHYGLYEVFPKNVMEETSKIPQSVLAKQKKGRVDFTNEVTFTIDGADARDFDDAISISKTSKGYTLGVHIADVGEYVPRDSIIDQEAFRRATSTYFPTSVLPMLPVELSNGICSLNEGVERLTLSCVMEIDFDGEVKSHKIVEGVIKSNARLTYKEVFACLEGQPTSEKAKALADKFEIMKELTEILLRKRKERGTVDLDVPEPKFVFDEKGYVIGVEKRERNLAHMMIEEFMVLANRVVAKEFADKNFPFVYRVHQAPIKEKVENVRAFMKGLGIETPSVPKNITSEYYQQLANKVEGKEDVYETVSKVLLRSMQKARYAGENLGHFGLALEYYCHFTSPIRRYPDLTIHRFIKSQLHHQPKETEREDMRDFAEESSLQSSEMEKQAEKAERDVDDLWKAYLMKDHVGEIFDGVITSVLNFGFFVELDNSVEGLVRLETLPNDSYLFMEKSLELKGGVHRYKIGDKVRVKLTAANIWTRKIDFELV